jgi:transposase
MDLNIKGKAPQANTLEEANKIIKALWDIIQRLDEKLKTSSKNSSLSPSKDRSSKNKSNIKRTEERKKNPKKQGGQPGHIKHERRLLSIDQVDHIVSCCPNDRCVCGGRVIRAKSNSHDSPS